MKPTTTNKDPLIHFPFYINQYQGLLAGYSFLEKGAFIALLCVYLSEDGQIPEESSKLFRMSGAFGEDEQLALSSVKDEVLRVGLEIIKSQKKIREKSREKASKAAKERWSKDNASSNAPSIQQAMLEECHTETEKETETELKKEIEKKTKPKPKGFIAPSLQEVSNYCQERKNSVDPKKFFDYYVAGDWKDAKGNSVKNWKQKLLSWEGRNQDTVAQVKDTILERINAIAGFQAFKRIEQNEESASLYAHNPQQVSALSDQIKDQIKSNFVNKKIILR
jgi:uncharacterized protein YdaU (DUF1376 family)